ESGKGSYVFNSFLNERAVEKANGSLFQEGLFMLNNHFVLLLQQQIYRIKSNRIPCLMHWLQFLSQWNFTKYHGLSLSFLVIPLQ
ncbi:hypothetical protein, partial [Hoylesella timonensis]|uniref:hypothetical protein n=1 Tax=Hoylesella timonensis TaxID=386414 RepID=UPI0024314876